MTAASGLDRVGWGQGVCAGDYDNDGRVDLFVTTTARAVLYRNQGGGVFADTTRPAGLAAPERYSTGCAFLDYDRDGRLDLFVSAYLAHEDARRYPPGTAGQNCSWKGLAVMCGPAGLRGAPTCSTGATRDGTFTDVSERAGILKAAPSFGFTPLVLDLRQRRLARRLRGQRFARRPALPQRARRHVQGARADGGGGAHARTDAPRPAWAWPPPTTTVTAGSTSPRPTSTTTPTSLYRNLGDGGFEESHAAPPASARNNAVPGLGHRLSRLRPRRLARPAHGQRTRLSRGRSRRRPLRVRSSARCSTATCGGGRFEDVSLQAGPGIAIRKAARGAAFGDLFNRGRVDVVVNNMNDAPTLLYDCAPTDRTALVVAARRHPLQPQRHRRPGAWSTSVPAALIDEVRSGGSFCSQNDLRLHFGLARARRPTAIEVEWPSGGRDVVPGVAAGQVVVIREGVGLVRTRASTATRSHACS